MPSTSTSVPIGSFMSDTGLVSMLCVESIWLTWCSYTAQDTSSPHKVEQKSTWGFSHLFSWSLCAFKRRKHFHGCNLYPRRVPWTSCAVQHTYSSQTNHLTISVSFIAKNWFISHHTAVQNVLPLLHTTGTLCVDCTVVFVGSAPSLQEAKSQRINRELLSWNWSRFLMCVFVIK